MELKLEALQTADEYIVRLQEGIIEVIGYYRNNQVDKGSALLIEIIDGLRWVVEVIESTQDAFVNLIDPASIKELLRDIIDALEKQDNVLIADLFEYEIGEILAGYQKEIKIALNYDRTLM